MSSGNGSDNWPGAVMYVATLALIAFIVWLRMTH